MSRKHWKRDGAGCGWHGGPWNRGGASSATWGEGGFSGRNFRILSGLRRDPYRGRVSGVCAGIAGYYGINLKLIRIAMIVCAFINPFLTISGYALATWLIKPMPEPRPDGGASEVNAGSSAQQAAREKAAEEELPPELRFAALKDKFRELEERTGAAETLVTSSEFRLRRDFKAMGEDKDDSAAQAPRFGAGPNGRPPMMGLVG
ncbi:PspC domain-containing protein [Dongia sp. agr-C8]